MRKIFLTILLVFGLLFSSSVAYAQSDQLAGVYGTEFWLGFLSNNRAEPSDPTLKLTLYAISEEPVSIAVYHGTSKLGNFKNVSTPGRQYLYRYDNLDVSSLCPPTDESEQVTNRGICIASDEKVPKTKFTCYAITEVGGTAAGSTRDATLLLPKDILGKEYFIQTFKTDVWSTEFIVVATEDNTTVNITPSCKTMNGASAGYPLSPVVLKKGEVYMVKSQQAISSTDIVDLSGSTVCADKPIAVFNGNEQTKQFNTGGASGNHTFEQAIPQTMWGTDFFVSLAGGTKVNFVQVTASIDATKVTIKIPGEADQEVTLAKGASLSEPIGLNKMASTVIIHADKPVTCYHYLSVGTSNHEEEYIGTKLYEYDWGNPTNALVVPWSHRTKEMSFYTDSIENHTAGAKQKFYIQLIIEKQDDGKLYLDGSATPIPSDSFHVFPGNTNMAYANIELVNNNISNHGKHWITSHGGGFTGFVHGMTGEARAYQYTLGFDPPKFVDSLFIKDVTMSPKSYDLAKMDQGWYQRQPYDFPIEEQRIDTAYMCDGTKLDFLGQMAAQNTGDHVIWKIWECDENGQKLPKRPASDPKGPNPVFVKDEAGNYIANHGLTYQFILDPMEDKKPEERPPFTLFSVDMEKYKEHLICTNLQPDADTLRTMIRVHRMYNDTTWKILCETDTIQFFEYNEDGFVDLAGGGPNKKTTFVYGYTGTSPDTVAFNNGNNVWSRKYQTQNGCDSIVTLKIFGCDSAYHRIDKVLCEEDVTGYWVFDETSRLRFNPYSFEVVSQAQWKDSIAAGKSIHPYTRKYISELKTPVDKCLKESNPEDKAYLDHCPEFDGCSDIYELYLTIMPLYIHPSNKPGQQEWCIKDPTEKFMWYRADGTTLIEAIAQNDPRFDSNGLMKIGKLFMHDPCTDCPAGGCPQEYDTLILHKAQDMDSVKHICQNETYVHDYGGNKRITYRGWELDMSTPMVHTEQIKIGEGALACEYESKLTLYVHPAYVEEHGLHWRDTLDTICIAKTASDHYVWPLHEGHDKVWLIKQNGTDVVPSVKVDPSNISTQEAGTFEFIDSLQTTTCTECENGYCDSIWHLTLIVAPEVHDTVTEAHLCRNKKWEYTWKGTTYYYYGEEYTPTAAESATGRLLKNTDWLNETCDGTKWYYETFGSASGVGPLGETRYGCDSTVTVKIHLDKTLVTNIDTFICSTEMSTYHFIDEIRDLNAETPISPNTYYLAKTIPTECGCDNGVAHTIHVRQAYPDVVETADTVCQWLKSGDNKYYTWTNHPRSGEPHRQIYMLDVTNNKGRYVWTNKIPLDSLAGTYMLMDSLKTKTCPKCEGGACDSIMSKLLTIIPTSDDTLHFTVSDKTTLEWVEANVSFVGPKATAPSGSWIIVKPAAGHADCYYTYKFYTTHDALGHSVGTHVETNGCDSIMTYHVIFGETYYFEEYDAVCENCSYTWDKHLDASGNPVPIVRNGQTTEILISDVPARGVTKDYTDPYKTSLNFDSIYVLHLTGYPAKVAYTSNAAICQGETYNWFGHPGQRSQLYLVNTDGSTTEIGTDYVWAKDGTYTVIDSMLTDTTYLNVGTGKQKKMQCDSIWTLTLTVHPTYTAKYPNHKIEQQRTICSNEYVLWEERLFVGYDYDFVAHPIPAPSTSTPYDSIVLVPTAAGTNFKDSVPRMEKTVHGCDSTMYLNLTIHPYQFRELVDHIGDNNTTWSFGGKPTSTLPRVTREDLVPSSSVKYDDSTRHDVKKFFFIDTLRTLNSCDSIVWDSVYIHPSYRFEFDTTVCSNTDWSWRPESPNAERFHNINTKVSGTYYDSLTTKRWDIDSVFVLHLIIEPAAKHDYGRDICKNDTVDWEHQKIYYQDNLKKIEVRYKTGALCDSILTFYPVFYEYYHRDVEMLSDISGYWVDSICQYDTLIWISPGETTPHTKALRGEKGEKFDHLPTDTFGINAQGDTVGIWMTVYDSLHTTAPCHCDSTYTLRYYVKPTFRYYDTVTICSNDTLQWRNLTLYSGFARQIDTAETYVTSGGACDSIYYLTLYVNQAYDSISYDTICGNVGKFDWQGHNLDAWLLAHEKDTLPIDTFLYRRYDTQRLDYGTSAACDSVFQLYLNVRPILTERWSDTICVGESYQLNAKSFTTSGVYTDTLVNAFGCDSFAVVDLAVVPATYFKVEPMTACADAGTYDLSFTFDTLKGYQPRRIQIVYDSLAIANGFPKDTVEIEVTDNTLAIDLPAAVGSEYVRPDNYSAKVYFDNGTCDDPELQRIDIKLTINYPSWITEQHWMDAIGILSADYNGDYRFSAYQWYKDDKELIGETKSYLFVPDYLEVGAEYKVLLTREGDTISFFTCPIVAQKRDSSLMPQKPYVSVVPTYVVRDNPVVHIMCSQHGGEFKLYNPYGSLVQTGRFEPGNHNAYEVRLPALSGVYLFELIQDEGERRTVKVIVN